MTGPVASDRPAVTEVPAVSARAEAVGRLATAGVASARACEPVAAAADIETAARPLAWALGRPAPALVAGGFDPPGWRGAASDRIVGESTVHQELEQHQPAQHQEQATEERVLCQSVIVDRGHDRHAFEGQRQSRTLDADPQKLNVAVANEPLGDGNRQRSELTARSRIVHQMFVEGNARSVPKIVRLLMKTPMSEIVNALQFFCIAASVRVLNAGQ